MRWCLALAALVLAGCHTVAGGRSDDDGSVPDARDSGSDGGSGSGSNAIDVFATSTTKVVVEIDYETGQQPYTGNMGGFGDTFEPTINNVDRLFAGKKTVTIPTTIADMQNVGAVNDEEITVADIAALAEQHRDQHDSADTKTYWMIFLSGHFADASGVQAQVLGVSVGDTVAMFKDVIEATGSTLSPNTARYVEQSTLVHELSHSIGLVDNGVPMVAPHEDAAHGPHCNNPDCVMYWLNEGASDATDFALRRLLTGDTLLFDAACLVDVDALTGGP
jgi:hypothetical protein